MKLTRGLVIPVLLALAACRDAGDQSEEQSAPIAMAAQAPQQSAPRRLWVLGHNDDVYDVSPDGRYAGYIDWNTGNLMVRDLQSGVVRNLTNKGTYDDSDDEAESALFSPDGQWVAFEWWDGRARQDELRIASIDGKTIRTLLKPKGYSVWPEEFTRDGKYILTYLDPCSSCAQRATADLHLRKMVLVPLDGDSVRELKAHPRNTSGWWEASPDGRYFAFARKPDPTANQRDIHLFDLTTQRETRVLEDTAGAFPFGWTDAGQLIFMSERAGTPGIWSIRIANGRVRGEPQLLRGDLWNMSPLRVLADGKVAYKVRAGNRDILTAGFDPTTGKLLSQPVSLTQRPGEAYHTPVWSPDGRHVAYVTRRPNSEAAITIRSIDGKEVREVRHAMTNLMQFNWLPNGRALLVSAADAEVPIALHYYDLGTGQTRVLARDVYPVVSASKDSRQVYYIPRTPTGGKQLKSIDLGTGQERVLYTGPDSVDLRPHLVTDDGRTALVVVVKGRPRGFWAITLESGKVRDLGATIPIGQNEWMRPVGLTRDGQYQIMATAKLDAKAFETLWRVPIAGGPAVRLGPAPNAHSDIQAAHSWMSPDGRRIMYVSGDLSTELWMAGPFTGR